MAFRLLSSKRRIPARITVSGTRPVSVQLTAFAATALIMALHIICGDYTKVRLLQQCVARDCYIRLQTLLLRGDRKPYFEVRTGLTIADQRQFSTVGGRNHQRNIEPKASTT